jgi:hypothetical protein
LKRLLDANPGYRANGNLAHFSRNSAAVQKGVAKRFMNEQSDVLRMLHTIV